MLDSELWSDDLKQACLQLMTKLNRETFTDDTVPEIVLNPKECLLLVKPLYGIYDSGDFLYDTIGEHLWLDRNETV